MMIMMTAVRRKIWGVWAGRSHWPGGDQKPGICNIAFWLADHRCHVCEGLAGDV